MKHLFQTAMITAAALLLNFFQPASASDLGLDDRNQVGERGVPQCFENTERTDRGMRLVTESDGPRTQDFAEFRKAHGLESIDRTDARPLEDPIDTETCQALGKKHVDEILEPHEGDPKYFGNVYRSDAAYYQIGDLYLVVIASAEPIATKHRHQAPVQTGMVDYWVTVYGKDLTEVWSRHVSL